MAIHEREYTGPRATDATGAWQLHGGGKAPFVVLSATVAVLGWLFYQMVRPMLLPLFLAGILALLVYPWHEKLLARLKGRDWLSATIFTLLFFSLVFGPLGIGIYYGLTQAMQLVRLGAVQGPPNPEPMLKPQQHPRVVEAMAWVQEKFGIKVEQLEAWAVDLGKSAARTFYNRSVEFVSDVPSFAVSILIFLFAFFFFLRDGRRLLSAWQRLTPMEASHDAVLRHEFAVVCRAVVWGTLMAAIAQGLCFGLGLLIIELFTHIGTTQWIFLLALLGTIAAMIPFVGAAVVWVPLALYMMWQGHLSAGIFLLVYGVAVISTVDNLVKIQTLGEGASLHPLLVFVSVFGGIQAFGVLGMFIGPIVGAVLFALLRVLKQELIRLQAAAAFKP